jgi:hypothetical protein
MLDSASLAGFSKGHRDGTIDLEEVLFGDLTWFPSTKEHECHVMCPKALIIEVTQVIEHLHRDLWRVIELRKRSS